MSDAKTTGETARAPRPETVRRRVRRRPSRAADAPRVYANLKTFLERRGGAHSPEDYYGCNHYDDYSIMNGPQPGRISVRYIEETGDLYAIDESREEHSRVALLGRLEEGPGRPMPPNRVSRTLQGWAAPDRRGRPISWFVNRLRETGSQ